MHGHDGQKAEELLEGAKRQGTAVLGTITKAAVTRLVDGHVGVNGPRKSLQKVNRLFTDEERQRLADTIAATKSTALLLGRARVRLRLAQAERHYATTKHAERVTRFADVPTDLSTFTTPIHPLAPQNALDFFRSLIPIPGITDPGRWGEDQHRIAFTLAETTEAEVLERVQNAITNILATGQGASRGPQVVQQILDDAGVSPRNPAYSENVYRTNMMSSFSQGFDEEMADPDVQDYFPCWRMANPADSRSRKTHAARNGRYYPNTMTFAEVRDSDNGGAFDGFGCRCVGIPIDRHSWADLQRRGATVTRFSEPHAETAPVPDVKQDRSFSCGAGALLSLAERYGLDYDEASLRTLLGTTPEDGTPPDAMLAGALQIGLDATAHEDWTVPSLERALLRGWSVIACVQWIAEGATPGLDAGHWVVFTGRKAGAVEVMDPSTGETVEVAKRDLPGLWIDQGADGRIYRHYGLCVKGLAAKAEKFCMEGANKGLPGVCPGPDSTTATSPTETTAPAASSPAAGAATPAPDSPEDIQGYVEVAGKMASAGSGDWDEDWPAANFESHADDIIRHLEDGGATGATEAEVAALKATAEKLNESVGKVAEKYTAQKERADEAQAAYDDADYEIANQDDLEEPERPDDPDAPDESDYELEPPDEPDYEEEPELEEEDAPDEPERETMDRKDYTSTNEAGEHVPLTDEEWADMAKEETARIDQEYGDEMKEWKNESAAVKERNAEAKADHEKEVKRIRAENQQAKDEYETEAATSAKDKSKYEAAVAKHEAAVKAIDDKHEAAMSKHETRTAERDTRDAKKLEKLKAIADGHANKLTAMEGKMNDVIASADDALGKAVGKVAKRVLGDAATSDADKTA